MECSSGYIYTLRSAAAVFSSMALRQSVTPRHCSVGGGGCGSLNDSLHWFPHFAIDLPFPLLTLSQYWDTHRRNEGEDAVYTLLNCVPANREAEERSCCVFCTRMYAHSVFTFIAEGVTFVCAQWKYDFKWQICEFEANPGPVFSRHKYDAKI